MTQDPLYTPLGTRPDAPPRRSGGVARAVLVMGLVAALGGGVALALRAGRTTPPDQATAVARIQPAPPPPVAAPAPVQPASPAIPAGPSDPTIGSEGSVEIQHGVKVIRLGAASSPNAIRLPAAGAPATPLAPAPDPRLADTTPDGVLPRIAADGTRPADAYARPTPPGAPGTPRLVLVVAGLGRDQVRTAEAIRRLPPAVTLAFAADAPDLPTQAREARAAGHELLLGLGTDAAGPDGIRHGLGRFPGYAGVLLPPALAADPASVAEIVRRGLFIVDDGTVDAPAGTRAADVTVAGDASAPSTALDRLAAIARARGSALGVVQAGAAAGDGLADFARALAGQGIDLVPASAVAQDRRGAAASR